MAELTVEELRMLIAQQIGVRHLLPLALHILEREPLAEGDFYPGDLLSAVLKLPREFWQEEPGWRSRVASIVEGIDELPAEIADVVEVFRSTR